MGMIWDFLVAGAILFGLSRAVPGVKCRSYLDAVKVAAVYALCSFVLSRIFLAVGFVPAVMMTIMLTAVFPPLGFLAAGLGVFVTFLVIGSISLFLADKFVDGYEIDGFGSTMVVVVAAGIVRSVLAVALGV